MRYQMNYFKKLKSDVNYKKKVDSQCAIFRAYIFHTLHDLCVCRC